MNIWRSNLLERCRNTVRFAFWVGLAIPALMGVCFIIAFTYHFLSRLWELCSSKFFGSRWG